MRIKRLVGKGHAPGRRYEKMMRKIHLGKDPGVLHRSLLVLYTISSYIPNPPVIEPSYGKWHAGCTQ